MSKSTKTLWTREAIQQFLDEVQPGYQYIELPHGLTTNGKNRPQINQLIFEGIEGKSLLDIGSCFGGFCIGAMRNGAKKAVGIELSRHRIRAAETMAEMVGVKAEFRFEDIERYRFDEKFDVTICLDVLHHLRNPFKVIQELVAATDGRLVLEIAAAGGHDRRKFRIGPVLGSFLSRLPAMLVAPYNPHGRRQTYFFTRNAMRTILAEHRRVFQSVKIIDSEFKNRFIVVADKLKIDRMVVFAGLTSSGKSTFRSKWLEGEFAGTLSSVDVDQAFFTGAQRIGKNPLEAYLPTNHVAEWVYHYDISRKETLNTYSFDRDVATDPMTLAKELEVVLICPDMKALQAQLEQSELFKEPHKQRKKHLRLKALYRDVEWLRSIHHDYINFCESDCRGKVTYLVYSGNVGNHELKKTRNASEAKRIISKIYPGY